MELHDSTYALGCSLNGTFSCEQDLAISQNFFLNPAFVSEQYILELKATNGQNATGLSDKRKNPYNSH